MRMVEELRGYVGEIRMFLGKNESKYLRKREDALSSPHAALIKARKADSMDRAIYLTIQGMTTAAIGNPAS